MLGLAILLAVAVLAPLAQAQPLLVGLVPDVPGGGDAVAIGARGPAAIAGLVLTDGESAWAVPANATPLPDGGTLWVVSDLGAWRAHQGPEPAIVMSPPLRLGNGGDDVRLLDASGAELDFVAYGDSDPSDVLPGATDGLLLQRDRGASTSSPGPASSWVDTDAAWDWVTPRRHKLGESTLDNPTFTADRVTVYASPDATFDVLAELLAGATQRLHLHVYELRSPALVDLLVAAKQRAPGLDLAVLVDGNPVGQTSSERHATADALRRIQAAGGTVVLAGNGRYDDHHLKVLVVDDAVAVQSENWVESGVPEDPTWGNRGWGAVVHGGGAADWFARWMAQDRAAWDAQPFDLGTYDPTFEAPPRRDPRTGDLAPRHAALTIPGPVAVTPLVSPDHTQDPRRDPVAALLAGADERIVAQQLDLALTARNGLGWSSPDPWTDALSAAAARGVPVRVQLAPPFAADDTGNRETMGRLRDSGAKAAELDRPGLATLHNKGFVIDGATVVVGSTNGNHHARSANREVSLVLASPAAAAYFTALADEDWDPPHPGRDWGVPGKDLRALPVAPWPTLLALLGVAAALRVRR